MIVRPDRLGDLVLSLPVAARLKSAYPGLEIHALVSHYNSPVLQFAGNINRGLYTTDSHGKPLNIDKLVWMLERESYHLALFLKPGWRTALAAFLADIPLRVGTSRRPYSFLFNIKARLPRRKSGMHEIDLNLSLLRPMGFDITPGAAFPELIKSAGIAPPFALKVESNYIIIHPGSGGSAPNWPAKLYAQLAELISRDLSVVITGKGVEQVSVNGKNIHNMFDKTDFEQLMSLVAQAKLFISGSTGPLHLAAALGVPVLALMPDHPTLGPVRWGPRGKKAFTLTPPKQSGHVCRIKNDGSCPCMASLSVDMVYKSALGILSSSEKAIE